MKFTAANRVVGTGIRGRFDPRASSGSVFGNSDEPHVDLPPLRRWPLPQCAFLARTRGFCRSPSRAPAESSATTTVATAQVATIDERSGSQRFGCGERPTDISPPLDTAPAVAVDQGADAGIAGQPAVAPPHEMILVPAGPFTMGADQGGKETNTRLTRCSSLPTGSTRPRSPTAPTSVRRRGSVPPSRRPECAGQPPRHRPRVPFARATDQQHFVGRRQGVLRLEGQAAPYRSGVGKSGSGYRRTDLPVGKRPT